MSLPQLLSLVGWFVAATAPSGYVDYGKIERSLAREPAYQTKSPKYALLVFGPAAKLRIWVVVDGERLYVDRNGDADLTAPNERFEKADECKNVEISDIDGKTRYVITAIGTRDEKDPPGTALGVSVIVKGPVEYQQYCDSRPSTRCAQPGRA